MMLYGVAIVLVLVHAILAVQANMFETYRDADDIEALCANKQVSLHYLSGLIALNEKVSDSSCSDQVKKAIPDLLGLIERTKDDLCSRSSVDDLRKFYSEYLDTSSTPKELRVELPKSLKRFALAYGMQMSNVCKRRMVYHLSEDVVMSRYEAVNGLVSDKSPIAKFLEGLVGPDEILLPADLAPYIKDNKADPKDGILYVQSAGATYIRTLQTNCTRHFEPVYAPLIEPLIPLANMGFNYKDKELRDKFSSKDTLRNLAQWSRLMFLCESLKNIRMVDLAKRDELEDVEVVKTMRILTKQEAAELDSKSVSDTQLQVDTYSRFPARFDTFQDAIYNTWDGKLKKAIKAFSTSKSEHQKVVNRMTRKGLSLFWMQIKRFNIGVLLSTGYKAAVHRYKTGESMPAPSLSEEIVNALGSAAGHESEFLYQPSDDSNFRVWDEGRIFGASLSGCIVSVIYLAFFAAVAFLIVEIAIAMAMG